MTTPNQTPEQRARDCIDDLLQQAGWVIQDKKKIDFAAAQGTITYFTNSTDPSFGYGKRSAIHTQRLYCSRDEYLNERQLRTLVSLMDSQILSYASEQGLGVVDGEVQKTNE